MSRVIRFRLREEVEIQEMLTLVAPNKKKWRKRRGGRRFLELINFGFGKRRGGGGGNDSKVRTATIRYSEHGEGGEEA